MLLARLHAAPLWRGVRARGGASLACFLFRSGGPLNGTIFFKKKKKRASNSSAPHTTLDQDLVAPDKTNTHDQHTRRRAGVRG